MGDPSHEDRLAGGRHQRVVREARRLTPPLRKAGAVGPVLATHNQPRAPQRCRRAHPGVWDKLIISFLSRKRRPISPGR